MRALSPLILGLALVAGCQQAPKARAGLGTDVEGASVGWRLAAAYDLAPLIAAGEEQDPGYLWLPYLAMEQFCGPSRRPSGLGVFEAEAMATGLTPTLALVLERTTEREVVPAESVRVAVGNEERKILLQPATERRHLAVQIIAQDDPEQRYEQLVRTQLEIELCLEHKLGRAWTGADTDLLREAFLLDPPRVGSTGGNRARNHNDRAYFGGQGAPVPALLGPPDACLIRPRSSAKERGSTTVVGGYDLVPSDVWSAGLRRCDEQREGDGKEVQAGPHQPVHLQLRAQGIEVAPRPLETWKTLTVSLRGSPTPADVELTVNYEGQVWGPEPLYQRMQGQPDTEAGGGVRDILARLPRRYPRLGPTDDEERYAVLLIPNWQIVDALRAIDSGSPEQILGSPSLEPQNGVAALLERPELLYVQVPPPDADDGTPPSREWPDLSSTMGPGPLGSRLWGYTVGFVAGRAPIALVGSRAPSWIEERAAQRARPQAIFIFSAAVLLMVIAVGLRRLPDLWTRVPEVAMDYWPGLSLEEQEEGGDTEAAAETAAKLTNA